jgi:hypothetical protein
MNLRPKALTTRRRRKPPGAENADLALTQPVAATASPDHEPTEPLRNRGVEHVFQQALEGRLVQVDEAAIPAMLGGGPVGGMMARKPRLNPSVLPLLERLTK